MKFITLVVAMAKNGAIGHGGRMPWHLPADLAHFKKITWGKPIVMGRKTFEAIGNPLPGRQNIVVSRNPEYSPPGCDVAASLEVAIELAASDEVMVIGGGQLYEKALPMANRMIVTEVDSEPEADTWFPEWDTSQWQEQSRQSFPANEKNRHPFSIVEYLRVTID